MFKTNSLYSTILNLILKGYSSAGKQVQPGGMCIGSLASLSSLFSFCLFEYVYEFGVFFIQ